MMVGTASAVVMPGLVPAIHAFCPMLRSQDVDGRHEPGHDDGRRKRSAPVERVE